MSRSHNQGEKNVGDIYLRNATQNANLFIGLYTNATQPLEEHVMTNIAEVTGGGYSRIALAPANWVEQAGQTAEGGVRYAQPEQVFVFNAAVGNIAGFFITNALTGTAGLLITSEHFPAVVNVNQAGFEVRIVPRIEFR